MDISAVINRVPFLKRISLLMPWSAKTPLAARRAREARLLLIRSFIYLALSGLLLGLAIWWWPQYVSPKRVSSPAELPYKLNVPVLYSLAPYGNRWAMFKEGAGLKPELQLPMPYSGYENIFGGNIKSQEPTVVRHIIMEGLKTFIKDSGNSRDVIKWINQHENYLFEQGYALVTLWNYKNLYKEAKLPLTFGETVKRGQTTKKTAAPAKPSAPVTLAAKKPPVAKPAALKTKKAAKKWPSLTWALQQKCHGNEWDIKLLKWIKSVTSGGPESRYLSETALQKLKKGRYSPQKKSTLFLQFLCVLHGAVPDSKKKSGRFIDGDAGTKTRAAFRNGLKAEMKKSKLPREVEKKVNFIFRRILK